MKKIIAVIIILILVGLGWLALGPGQQYWRERRAFAGEVSPLGDTGRRVLVLAPHPDDETFGAGGVMLRSLSRHAKVRVVVVTNGNHFIKAARLLTHKRKIGGADLSYLAGVRQNETREALRIIGVPMSDVTFLGYPDGGLAGLLKGKTTPSGQNLADLERSLQQIMADFRPTDLYYPALQDEHPDHRALGMVVVRLIRERGIMVRQHQYLIHYQQNRWPSFPRLYRYLPLMPPLNLYHQGRWENLSLTSAESRKKWEAVNQYRSQLRAVGGLYLTYARGNEIFLDPSTR